MIVNESVEIYDVRNAENRVNHLILYELIKLKHLVHNHLLIVIEKQSITKFTFFYCLIDLKSFPKLNRN